MAKVTEKEIQQMNELYYECKTFAEVARRTGRSASTVKKYIDINWKPDFEIEKKNYIFNKSMIINDGYHWNGNENLGRICVLTEEEKEMLKEIKL